MKYVSPQKIKDLPGHRLHKGETFTMKCHQSLSCFGRCCHNLNLFLHPYDVLRLKRRLAIHSDPFIDKYVDVVMRPDSHFPDVLLKMASSTDKECVFLKDSTCAVYSDRPYTCRLFPVEQGSYYDSQSATDQIVNWFKPPDFCLGKHDPEIWTADGWIENQGAVEYLHMTQLWAKVKLRFQEDPWGGKGFQSSPGKMAFMSIYNIDLFREFVFNSSFLNRYIVASSVVETLRHDDSALMKFGFEWVTVFLWKQSSSLIQTI